MRTKKILIPIAIVAMIGAGAYSVSQASAASSPTTGQSLVTRIASAFNLDPSKVQAVVNQYRSDQSADRETKYQDRLNQAVAKGQLTAAQETAILAEHNTLTAVLTSAMSQTGANRRTAIMQVRQEAQSWATANNIALKWIFGPGQLRGGHGHKNLPARTSTPSPSVSPSVQ